VNYYSMEIVCHKCQALEGKWSEESRGEDKWEGFELHIIAKGWRNRADNWLCPSCAKTQSACPFDGCDDHKNCMICLVEEAMEDG